MKRQFANLLIYFLRKLDVSVIINMKVEGTLTPITNQCSIYKCNFENCNLLDSTGQKISIPSNKPFDTESDKFVRFDVFTESINGNWLCWENLYGREFYGPSFEEVQDQMEKLLNETLKSHQIAYWKEPKNNEERAI